MKRTVSVLTALLLCLFAVLPAFAAAPLAAEGAALAGQNELRFGSDGKFTILHLTDTQDDEHLARQLIPFLRKAVETARPDLVVMTGDVVEDSRPVADFFTDDEPFFDGVVVGSGSRFDYEKTLANVRTVCDAVFGVFEEYGVPFAVAQGNNDYKAKISNEDWLKIYASYPHCVNAFDLSGDEDGHIDSYVSVLSSSSDNPAYGLWLLDDGRGFSEAQAEWMKAYPAPDVPSLAFAHVPVNETGCLFTECSPTDAGAFITDGKVMRLDPEISTGHAETRTAGDPSLMFAAFKAVGVKGAFFGHTHVDGYTGVYDGVTLGLTYGCEFSKISPYGMRTVTLTESEPEKIDTSLYVYTGGSFVLQTRSDFDEPGGKTDAVAKTLNFIKFLLRHVLYRLGLLAGRV